MFHELEIEAVVQAAAELLDKKLPKRRRRVKLYADAWEALFGLLWDLCYYHGLASLEDLYRWLRKAFAPIIEGVMQDALAT